MLLTRSTSCTLRFMQLSILFIGANPVFAAEWTSSAAISAGTVYTDNVRLDDDNKESDLIAVVTPQGGIRGEGRRASINIDGAVQFNNLSGEADNVKPRGYAFCEVELVAFVYRSGYQSRVDPFALSAGDTLNRDNNSVTTYNYGISPIFKTRLDDFANLDLRYRYDEQTFSGERRREVDKSSGEQALLRINSGERFSRLTWNINGRIDKSDYDNDRDRQNSENERRSLEFTARYRIDRKWQLTGTVGQEWNDFVSARDTDQDDKFWRAGVIWTPNDRTTVEAGYGERFFGNTPYVEFRHHTRRTRLSLGYTRQLTDTRSIRRLQRDLFPDEDPFGQPVDPFTGEPFPLEDNLTFPSNSVVINDRFDASFSVVGNRSSVNVDLRQSKQTRADTGEDATFNYASVSFDRSLSRLLTLTSKLNWREQKREDAAFDDSNETLRFTVGGAYAIGKQTSLTLEYGYSQGDSDFGERNYHENRLTVYVLYRF